jgi:hypothetical protein
MQRHSLQPATTHHHIYTSCLACPAHQPQGPGTAAGGPAARPPGASSRAQLQCCSGCVTCLTWAGATAALHMGQVPSAARTAMRPWPVPGKRHCGHSHQSAAYMRMPATATAAAAVAMWASMPCNMPKQGTGFDCASAAVRLPMWNLRHSAAYSIHTQTPSLASRGTACRCFSPPSHPTCGYIQGDDVLAADALQLAGGARELAEGAGQQRLCRVVPSVRLAHHELYLFPVLLRHLVPVGQGVMPGCVAAVGEG